MSDMIDTVRRFNRAVTRRVGALDDSYLARGRPLGEARLLFEIGRRGADLATLRDRLGLDSGYLSRLLRALEKHGLVSLDRRDDDARQRRARLTERGLAELAAYDRLSDDLARSILSPLRPADRERLVAAMAEVERLLRAGTVSVEIEPPASSLLRRCLDAYFAELNSRFDSRFDPARGAPYDLAAYAPPTGAFVLARLDGEAVGCAGLAAMDGDGTFEIKRMWTAPQARGLGVARRMLGRIEQIAAELGATRLVLDTNRSLSEAQALYRAEGYAPIPRYNDNPYADFWFEKRLAG